MTDPETDLRSIVRRLAAADRKRDQLAAERDLGILDFVEAGQSWTRAQQVTGLSRRGVQLSLERARARTMQADVAKASPETLIEFMPWLDRLSEDDRATATAELIEAARADRLASIIIRWRDKAGRV